MLVDFAVSTSCTKIPETTKDINQSYIQYPPNATRGGLPVGCRGAHSHPLLVSSTTLKKTWVFHILVVNTTYYIETTREKISKQVLGNALPVADTRWGGGGGARSGQSVIAPGKINVGLIPKTLRVNYENSTTPLPLPPPNVTRHKHFKGIFICLTSYGN